MQAIAAVGGASRTAVLFHALVVGFAVVSVAPGAWAGDGTILSVDGADLYVDLGRADGVQPGQRVTVLRVVSLEHPQTHRAIAATFPLGDAQVVMVNDAMSIVRVAGPARWTPRVGDRVAPPPRAPAATPAPTSTPAAEAPSHPAVDLLGLPLAERIALLQAFLRQHPDAPEAVVLRRELEVLTGWQSRQAATPAPSAPREAPVGAPASEAPSLTAAPELRVYHRSPRVAYADKALPISVLAWPSERFGGAVLYYGGRDGHWQAVAMRRAGGPHLRAEVPASAVRPDDVAYYVEVMALAGGDPYRAGSASQPLHVRVPEVPPDRPVPPPAGRTEVSLFAELADFNMFNSASPGANHDWVQLYESSLLYRVQSSALWALRMGFGVMRGEGGTVAQLDDPRSFAYRNVGFDFGFLETELQLSPIVSAIGRLSVGSAERIGIGAGAAGYLRFGSERDTNLLAGASTTPGMGEVVAVRFHWRLHPAWRIVGAIEVTDQPVQSDWGVRLLTEIGWSFVRFLEIDVRAGYDARTLRHAGGSLGAGVTLRW